MHAFLSPSPLYRPTTSERIYAIGDIHGCAAELSILLDMIHQDWNATRTPGERPIILPLGDLIDRGPESKRVMDIISRGHHRGIPIRCLLGNHDWIFAAFIEHRLKTIRHWKAPALMEDFTPSHTWMDPRNGCLPTLRSYGYPVFDRLSWVEQIPNISATIADVVPSVHQHLLNTMLPFYETERYVFVHGGLHWHLGLNTHPIEMLWLRDGWLSDDRMLPDGRIVVHGHTRHDHDPLHGESPRGRINLDSGCYKTGVLTCLVCGDRMPEPRYLRTGERTGAGTREGRGDCSATAAALAAA